jgi:hypothetical protein
MNKDFLVLYTPFPIWEKYMGNNNVDICAPYKNMGIITRILKKVLKSLGILDNKLIAIFLGNWKKKLNTYKCVIIFAYNHDYSYGVIKYVCKKMTHGKVIVWYWNPVIAAKNSILPSVLWKMGCQLWSFDKADCERWNMQYNTAFYLKELVPEKIGRKEYDVLFCGQNKGRGALLNTLYEKFISLNMNVLFYVVDETLPKSQRLPYLEYEIYLDYVSKSNILLDIAQPGQSGYTLRVMEAFFFGKKLITNQKSVKEADFYDPNNIFIIDMDSWDELDAFLQKDIVPLSSSIVEKYTYQSWLRRFGK